MSYLDKIRACNAWEPGQFLPLFVDGQRVGSLKRDFAPILTERFGDFETWEEGLRWRAPAAGLEARSKRLDAIIGELVDDGVIGYRHGERYPLTPSTRDRAVALIDRAAAPHFGARAFGQHLNGFVRRTDGLYLWVARRAADRRHYPSHLDNLVAGGLPYGVSLGDNLRKECREEADIPPQLADRAVPVGAVSYCRAAETGLKPDVMLCYDLELPQSFLPRNTDGEVESFALLPAAEVARLVQDTEDFKLNCNLVVIDFLIRHGILTPDQPDYIALVQGLRAPLP